MIGEALDKAAALALLKPARAKTPPANAEPPQHPSSPVLAAATVARRPAPAAAPILCWPRMAQRPRRRKCPAITSPITSASMLERTNWPRVSVYMFARMCPLVMFTSILHECIGGELLPHAAALDRSRLGAWDRKHRVHCRPRGRRDCAVIGLGRARAVYRG